MSIATELDKLKSRRDSIVSAINEKGGSVASGASLAQCATAIADIPSGGVTTITGNFTPASDTSADVAIISDSRITSDSVVAVMIYSEDACTSLPSSAIISVIGINNSAFDFTINYNAQYTSTTSSGGAYYSDTKAQFKISSNSIIMKGVLSTKKWKASYKYNWLVILK